jgi:DNA repair exonuclease SbcCD ATPase subunit
LTKLKTIIAKPWRKLKTERETLEGSLRDKFNTIKGMIERLRDPSQRIDQIFQGLETKRKTFKSNIEKAKGKGTGPQALEMITKLDKFFENTYKELDKKIKLVQESYRKRHKTSPRKGLSTSSSRPL